MFFGKIKIAFLDTLKTILIFPYQKQQMIDMMDEQLNINYNIGFENFVNIIIFVLEQSVDNPSETNFFQVENDGFLVINNPQSAYYFSIFNSYIFDL